MTASSPPAGAKVLGLRRRGLRARLRDARIRTKLGLILIIPLLAVLALATDRIVQHGQQALGIEQIRQLTELGNQASAVVQEVQHERMTAATFLANPNAQSDQYLPQIRKTDQAVAAYKSLRGALSDVPATVADRLTDVDQQIEILESTRQQVLTRSEITISAVVLRYGALAEGLVTYRESLGQVAGDTDLGNQLRAAAALSRNKLQISQAQSVAFVALRAGSIDDEQLTSFLSTLIGQQESLAAFVESATPEQRALVSTTLTGDAINLAEAVSNDVIRSRGRSAPLVTADDASRALGSVVDLIRWVEERIDAGVLAAATSLRNTTIYQVVGELAAVLIVLIAALVIALMLARALVRSLNELRIGALRVADRDLPETVARLSDRRTLGDTTPAEVVAALADPIQLSSTDEVGEVARAFNIVHREAVRVAAEQAALNTSVSVMFSNLARRSQSLVDQMIAHLDEMERSEEDSKRLSRLFRLDHLATRMRRNDENLLVLAGADSSPARREDSLVADVLRAAQAEIEHYARIEFGPVDIDALVASQAVNDVVRLLAELFDNATRFSPPDSAVLVSARLYMDSVLIQIEDRGVGIAPEQVAFFNSRLAAPPTMDIAAFRMMGLAVVGRLAARHRIQIELHGGPPGQGTTVYIKLPGQIIQLRRGASGYDLPGGRPPLAVPSGPGQRWPEAIPAAPMGGGGYGGGGPAGGYGGQHGPVSGYGGQPGGPISGFGGQQPGGLPGRTPSYPQQHNGSVPYATPPPSGFPSAELAMVPAAPASQWPSSTDDTAEMPIFREMEANWFRSNHSLPVTGSSMSTSTVSESGWTEPVAAIPQQRDPVTVAPPARTTSVPPPARTAARGWQTVADEGWRTAGRLADAPVRTQTRTGLPKRVPQAQLVPGGVGSEGSTSTTASQRNPDDVRGLLSAYHRGVQRGRGVE